MELQSIKTIAHYTSTTPPKEVPEGQTADRVEVFVTPEGECGKYYIFLRRVDGTYLRYDGPIGWIMGDDR